MRSPRQHLSAGIVLAILALAAPLAITASATTPLKITDCDSASVRPRQVVLTCADANSVLKSLTWSSFGGATAQGKGTFLINTCEPNCAEGRALSYKVDVKATSPRSCPHALRVYNELSLVFVGHPPSEANDFKRWTLGCPI